MKLQAPKRIHVEDFPSEYENLVDTLASLLNTFNDEVYVALDGRANISDNLNQEIVSLKIKVDGSGSPTTQASFTHSLITRSNGLMVIKANYGVTASPFIEYSEKDNLITISKIHGLTASTEYTLTLLVIGD